MTIALGTRLGPYETTAKQGEGGMGEVYRATDTKLERQAAIVDRWRAQLATARRSRSGCHESW